MNTHTFNTRVKNGATFVLQNGKYMIAALGMAVSSQAFAEESNEIAHDTQYGANGALSVPQEVSHEWEVSKPSSTSATQATRAQIEEARDTPVESPDVLAEITLKTLQTYTNNIECSDNNEKITGKYGNTILDYHDLEKCKRSINGAYDYIQKEGNYLNDILEKSPIGVDTNTRIDISKALQDFAQASTSFYRVIENFGDETNPGRFSFQQEQFEKFVSAKFKHQLAASPNALKLLKALENPSIMAALDNNNNNKVNAPQVRKLKNKGGVLNWFAKYIPGISRYRYVDAKGTPGEEIFLGDSPIPEYEKLTQLLKNVSNGETLESLLIKAGISPDDSLTTKEKAEKLEEFFLLQKMTETGTIPLNTVSMSEEAEGKNKKSRIAYYGPGNRKHVRINPVSDSTTIGAGLQTTKDGTSYEEEINRKHYTEISTERITASNIQVSAEVEGITAPSCPPELSSVTCQSALNSSLQHMIESGEYIPGLELASKPSDLLTEVHETPEGTVGILTGTANQSDIYVLIKADGTITYTTISETGERVLVRKYTPKREKNKLDFFIKTTTSYNWENFSDTFGVKFDTRNGTTIDQSLAKKIATFLGKDVIASLGFGTNITSGNMTQFAQLMWGDRAVVTLQPGGNYSLYLKGGTVPISDSTQATFGVNLSTDIQKALSISTEAIFGQTQATQMLAERTTKYKEDGEFSSQVDASYRKYCTDNDIEYKTEAANAILEVMAFIEGANNLPSQWRIDPFLSLTNIKNILGLKFTSSEFKVLYNAIETRTDSSNIEITTKIDQHGNSYIDYADIITIAHSYNIPESGIQINGGTNTSGKIYAIHGAKSVKLRIVARPALKKLEASITSNHLQRKTAQLDSVSIATSKLQELEKALVELSRAYNSTNSGDVEEYYIAGLRKTGSFQDIFNQIGDEVSDQEITNYFSIEIKKLMSQRNASTWQRVSDEGPSAYRELRRKRLLDCKETFEAFRKAFGVPPSLTKCAIPAILDDIRSSTDRESSTQTFIPQNDVRGYIQGPHGPVPIFYEAGTEIKHLGAIQVIDGVIIMQLHECGNYIILTEGSPVIAGISFESGYIASPTVSKHTKGVAISLSQVPGAFSSHLEVRIENKETNEEQRTEEVHLAEKIEITGGESGYSFIRATPVTPPVTTTPGQDSEAPSTEPQNGPPSPVEVTRPTEEVQDTVTTSPGQDSEAPSTESQNGTPSPVEVTRIGVADKSNTPASYDAPVNAAGYTANEKIMLDAGIHESHQPLNADQKAAIAKVVANNYSYVADTVGAQEGHTFVTTDEITKIANDASARIENVLRQKYGAHLNINKTNPITAADLNKQMRENAQQ